MYEKSPFAGQTFASFGTAKRFCRKCLTKDMPDAAYFENMYEYIKNLDEDIKAPDALYQERLSLCRQCESRNPPASASQVLGLKACATTVRL